MWSRNPGVPRMQAGCRPGRSHVHNKTEMLFSPITPSPSQTYAGVCLRPRDRWHHTDRTQAGHRLQPPSIKPDINEICTAVKQGQSVSWKHSQLTYNGLFSLSNELNMLKNSPSYVLYTCLSRSVMSDLSWPHQAPLSTGFPSKNTGVGCHFLLQGIFPRTEPASPVLAGRFFMTEPQRKPCLMQ